MLQTVCRPAMDARPGIGGLVLWADERNYLRLDVGKFGQGQVALLGCLGDRDVVIGRGLLPESDAEQVILRLERVGGEVRAFCAAGDARGQWYAVGRTALAAGPLQVGMHAAGLDILYRMAYPGAHRQGTAMRFEALQVWAE